MNEPQDWSGCIDDPGVAQRFLEDTQQYERHMGNAIRIQVCDGCRTVGLFDGKPAMSEDMHEEFLADHAQITPENN